MRLQNILELDNMKYNRVKDLAEQAGYLRDIFGFGIWDSPELHTYSELLIEECIKVIQLGICRDGHNTSHYQQSKKHINELRAHFGILDQSPQKRAVFYKSEYPEDYGDEVHVTNVREGEQDSDAILRAVELYSSDKSFYVREI